MVKLLAPAYVPALGSNAAKGSEEVTGEAENCSRRCFCCFRFCRKCAHVHPMNTDRGIVHNDVHMCIHEYR